MHNFNSKVQMIFHSVLTAIR